MGVIDWIKDWIGFRSMVTPVFLKVMFHILFWVMNIGAVLGILAYIVMGILALFASANNDLATIIIGVVILLIMGLVFLALLVLYNFFLRVYFELLLLLFNMYDSLKNIENSLKKK